MPYTGNLVRLQTQQPDARQLPPPSPRHAADEQDPAAALGEHEVTAGTGSEFGGTGFASQLATGPGLDLDRPKSWAIAPPGGMDEVPYAISYAKGNPHDSRATLSARDAADPVSRVDSHNGEPDRGVLRVTYSPRPLGADLQERDALSVDGFASPYSSMSEPRAAKHVRGINSLPENNPDRFGYTTGFRPGIDRLRAWFGDAARHITRDHTPQLLQPRDAYTAPPRQRMVADMVTDPALPRTAPNMDDTITASTNYTSQVSSSFGGF